MFNRIDLQGKTKPKQGSIESYWFKNENIGLNNTLFHRITIPLEPFDSGLEYVDQPEETEFVIDWINLHLDDPSKLDNIEITSQLTKGVEATIYVGCAHNWSNIHSLKLKEIEPDKYEIHATVTVEFKNEGVAQNEKYNFTTTAIYKGMA